jgi:hypothetical protein
VVECVVAPRDIILNNSVTRAHISGSKPTPMSFKCFPLMGCQQGTCVYQRGQRPLALHRPLDRHMHRPSSYSSIIEGCIHFYKPTTKCSSDFSSTSSSRQRRNIYGCHLCACVTVHSSFLIMFSLLEWTSMSPHFLPSKRLF